MTEPRSRPEPDCQKCNYLGSADLRDYIEARLNANEKALELARSTMEGRLESMNEFHNQLREQAALLITRNEVEIIVEHIKEEISLLRESRANIVEKLNGEIRDLRESRSKEAGKASMGAVYLSIAIAVLAAVIGLVSFFH
jgi:hypothetical protein